MKNQTVISIKEDLKVSNSLGTVKFREWYQDNKVSKKHSPWLHPLFNFGLLILTCIISISKASPIHLKTLLLFPLTLLLGNLVVFLLHRYPLHRRMKFFPFPYDEHTIQHHRYFDFANITLTGPRDFANIFFPWFIIASFVLLACPTFFALGFLYNGVSAGWFFVFCAAFYFTLYEVVHLSCHLKEDHWWLMIPGLKSMRQHHRIHHHHRLMSRYNFCIVYPLFDYIFRTKYKGNNLPEEKHTDHTKDVEKNLDGAI